MFQIYDYIPDNGALWPVSPPFWQRLQYWCNRVPTSVALQQAAYERCCVVWRLRRHGLELKEIAWHLKISGARVWQLEKRYFDNLQKYHDQSPVELYFANTADIATLARKVKRHADAQIPQDEGRQDDEGAYGPRSDGGGHGNHDEGAGQDGW